MDGSLIVSDLLKLPKVMEPIVSAINVYLHRRPILYGKICRILSIVMKHLDDEKDKDGVFEMIEKMMYILLPSFSLIENNSGLSKDLWSLLNHFSFSYRFKYYRFWKNESYDQYPELWCPKVESDKDTKYMMRRYKVDKDSQKSFGRQFARFINGQPTLVFGLVLKQVSYKDTFHTKNIFIFF